MNLNIKKLMKTATINGIIRAVLFVNFLKQNPKATEPNMAEISYAIGISAL